MKICKDCGFVIRDTRIAHDCYLACREAINKLRNLSRTNPGYTASFGEELRRILHYTDITP